MNTVKPKESSIKEPEVPTRTQGSTKPSPSTRKGNDTPSPPLSPDAYGIEDFKAETREAIEQALAKTSQDLYDWKNRGHDCLNWGLFLWFLLAHFVPGLSTLNKFWKIVYYGGTGIPTAVAQVSGKAADKVAPKVDDPIKEKEMIGDCIMVTSSKKMRTITVQGKTVTRPHNGWDFAPTFACYDKTPDSQEDQIHRVFAVGDKGDEIKVTCTPPNQSGGYGWLAVVENKTKGFGMKYAHLQKGVLNMGTTCTAGEFKLGETNHLVGLMGNTGFSSGIHLHAEIYDLKSGERWNQFPRYMAYRVFGEEYDPLIQRGEKK